MKHLFLAFFLTLSTSVIFGQEPIRNYDYTFKISGLSDSTDSIVFMANYYGGKQYYFDTGLVENGGIVHFKGNKIGGGIYSIILSDRKSYFEFVVNEPVIHMETRVGDFVKNMKVKTSIENKNFYEYLLYINDKSQRVQELRTKLEATEGSEKEKVKEELKKIDAEVVAYKTQFIQNHPDLFISKVFAASEEPDVPDYKEIEDEKERSRKRYVQFKKGYLTTMDFSDERLLRTPVFHNKLNYYLTKLTPQVPDSIIEAADMMVAMTKGNKETHKYVVHTITSKYEDSKVMGMDAILVHMGQTYYCPDKAWWLSEEKLKKFCERIDAMEPLLIGNIAPNLILQDTSGAWVNMHELKNNYTILYFWDSGCGHCKKVTPKLKEFYAANKDKGIEVVAIGTEFESEDWKKYIRKNGLEWINVSDTPEANENAHDLIFKGITTLESMNFRDTYDIFSTPKVFVLDSDKRIIATKLSPEQIAEFIENYSKQQADKG
ncbi:MAG: TlpA disulfide reductase family protein [Cryomorphaceae bacterium]